ncbi:MAG: tetratricopeptide repeat protein [Candidatus Kapaibacterium sp.]
MNAEEMQAEIVRLEQAILNLDQLAQVESDTLTLLNVIAQHPDMLTEVDVYRVHFIHSQALWLQNSNQPALDIALEILEWSENVRNMPFLIRTYAHCGALYRNLGRFQESLSAYTTARDLSNEIGYHTLMSGILGGLGQLYRSMHENEKAEEFLLAALQLAEHDTSPRRVASWCGALGLLYDDIGQYHQAIHYYKKALDICQENNYHNSIATWSGNLGVSYMNIADYVQALQYYQKALQINEEQGNTDSIAINIGNIGNVYFCLGELDRALEYYHRALALYEQHDHLQGIADCTGNIGSVYVQSGNYELAIEYYNRNIAINQRLGYHHGIANNTGNLGSAYMRMGEFTTALEHLNAALTLHQEVGNKHGTALWYGALGTVYAHREFEGYDQDTAVEYLHKALAICEEEGLRKDAYEFHKSLAELYEQSEEWQKFAHHYKLYRDIEHEVITAESRRMADKFTHERKIAEQEKRIAIEQARNDEIMRQQHILEEQAAKIQLTNTELHEKNIQLHNANQQLEEANTFKMKILGIASHDLKNPITALNLYVHLLRKHTAALPEATKMLEMITGSSKRMLDIIINLIDVAARELGQIKLVRTPIDTAALTADVVADYIAHASQKEQTIAFTCEGNCTLSADAERLRQVLDNLISNAVKYTERGKEIRVSVTRTDALVQITVADEGQGLSSEDMELLFKDFQKLSSRPTGGEGSTGLGLSVVKHLIELHGGRVWAESAGKGHGSTFFVELPG